MDTAFGPGNRDLQQAFTTAPFKNGTNRLRVSRRQRRPGDPDERLTQTSALPAADASVIGSFVSGGGHVFLKAAPNQGRSFGMIFGVLLNDEDATTFSFTATVTPAGSAAGLLNGGLTIPSMPAPPSRMRPSLGR